jgi:hypothetical protein
MSEIYIDPIVVPDNDPKRYSIRIGEFRVGYIYESKLKYMEGLFMLEINLGNEPLTLKGLSFELAEKTARNFINEVLEKMQISR